MNYKPIFKKKKIKFYNFSLIFLPILLVLIIIYINFNIGSKFITIPEYKGNFYIIPKDKGGQKILNTDKKSLNLKNIDIVDNDLTVINKLLYSIQFYTSEEYSNVVLYLNKLVNANESIFKKTDFFIINFYSEVSIEYFLLYKNFNTREKAYNYCIKYLTKLDNCLIVDVEKFKN